MKIVKFEGDYYLVNAGIPAEGDYYMSEEGVCRVYKSSSESMMERWIIKASTTNIPGIKRILLSQIEKPLPTVFSQDEMIKYSNWILEWCTQNKYRKVMDGAKPFGTGDEYSDNQLFGKYLERYIDHRTEWTNVKVEDAPDSNYLNIIELN